MSASPSRITRRLESASSTGFALYAISASFCTYFCMYAFRKPFAAGNFEGDFGLLGLDLKTGLVISQIVGYGLSKYIGIKVCSEIARAQRGRALVGLVLFAEFARVLVGLAPGSLMAVGLFLNGMARDDLGARRLVPRRTPDIGAAARGSELLVHHRKRRGEGRRTLADGARGSRAVDARGDRALLPAPVSALGVAARPAPAPR